MISGAAYDHVRGRIDADFVDLGDKDLKNIARPARVYAVRTGSQSSATAPSASESNKQSPPRLSMVVLPFANIGHDPEQEHFVDGVTESLTTDLSRIRGAVVIGRNTAFTYKGKPSIVKTIGRELNIRYVLEGSVQRGGNRMRVNVQLIVAETGNHLWAERFDKPLAELFDMQDEIVARLARTNFQIVAAEARRAEHAPTPTRWTSIFKVRLGSIRVGPRQHRASAQLFRSRVLRRSRQCRRAHWIGGSGRGRGRKSLRDGSHGGLRGGRSEVDQSLVVGSGPWACAYDLGLVDMLPSAPPRASPNVNMRWRWIEILPAPVPLSDLVRFLSVTPKKQRLMSPRLCASARATPSLTSGRHTRVSRRSTSAFRIKRSRGIEGRSRPTEIFVAYFPLGAALAQLGRLEEARSGVKAGLALNPSYTLSRARADLTAMSTTQPISPS